MTLSAAATRIQYVGDGTTTTFAIPFSFQSNGSYVAVYKRDETTTPAVETLQTNGSDYTISGANVVFGVAPVANIKILIIRTLPFSQTFDAITNGAFLAESLESQVDRITMMLQQLSEELDRCVKFPITYNTTDRRLAEPSQGKFLKWDGSGNLTNDTLGSVSSATVDGSNVAVSNGATESTITLGVTMPNTNYKVSVCWRNTVDASPDFQPLVITAKTTTSFTVKWNVATSSANYSLEYIAIA